MEHERLHHHRVFRCFDHRHKSQLWRSENQLQEHYLECHPDMTSQQRQNFIDLSETTVADSRDTCPFCDSSGPFPNGLYNHMAFHQETLATFAAPRNLDEQEQCGSNDAQGTNSVVSLTSH